ncbi:MAG: hypothetical protein Q7K44_03560 [Candidatus Liptonbacteria bacterium]|nr:hypothetical protein [Candidatus Liptonbacteria bacterium]
MKYALGIILISVTLTTIVLGGFMISHNSSNHIQCPISIFGSNNCANIINPFKFALSHINTIIGISTGITVMPLLFLVLAISMFFVLSVPAVAGLPQKSFFAYATADKNLRISSTQKWLGWLSVLEKRDPWEFSAAKI